MFKSPIKLRILAIAILCSLGLVTANAQEALEKWDEFDFAVVPLKSADIDSLELYELQLLRGIIFGRHGRVFKDVAIRKYLAA
ncbi:MAG TPA: hypothetical protein VFH01_01015, partial [Pyrinomonadaceae bacterium]|nr:hypothetical protein [Pyrinomonadaceae bacterium]